MSNINQMQMKPGEDKILTVGAGATWKQVIDFLNPMGFAVDIMQTDYDFSIGGSIATNVHGWQANKPPLISTVKGFTIVLANGGVQYCTKDNENKDLFNAAIGGYGLLGVVTEIELQVRENKVYKLNAEHITKEAFVKKFEKSVIAGKDVEMFFARFDLDKNNFLDKLVFSAYTDTKVAPASEPLKDFNNGNFILNKAFAFTQYSNIVKLMRQYLERKRQDVSIASNITRNQLMYNPVGNYVTRNDKKIDLLQEYFIPRKNFVEFVQFLQSIKSDLAKPLMNITLRQVNKDDQSILNYANDDMIAFVMFFRGPKNQAFEVLMEKISLKMTDKSLSLEGNYYLPYRAYQTKEQFQKAYPKFQTFNDIKAKYDPEKHFTNKFYENYLESPEIKTTTSINEVGNHGVNTLNTNTTAK